MPRPAPDPIPADAAPIAAIVRPEILAELPAARQIAVWCAAHGTTQHALAGELGIDPSLLSRVRDGRAPSAPIVAAIEARTGVRIGP